MSKTAYPSAGGREEELPHLLQDAGKPALQEVNQDERKVAIPNKATAPPVIPVRRSRGEGGRESSCLSAVPHIFSARPAENQPAAAGLTTQGRAWPRLARTKYVISSRSLKRVTEPRGRRFQTLLSKSLRAVSPPSQQTGFSCSKAGVALKQHTAGVKYENTGVYKNKRDVWERNETVQQVQADRDVLRLPGRCTAPRPGTSACIAWLAQHLLPVLLGSLCLASDLVSGFAQPSKAEPSSIRLQGFFSV